MNIKLAVSCLVLTGCLTGCAHQTLYSWGDYADHIFVHEQNELTDEEYLARLEKDLIYAETVSHKVPPGLYADVGTAYLQLGDAPKALSYYEKERDLWPEGRSFMELLIQGVKKNMEGFKGNSK